MAFKAVNSNSRLCWPLDRCRRLRSAWNADREEILQQDSELKELLSSSHKHQPGMFSFGRPSSDERFIVRDKH